MNPTSIVDNVLIDNVTRSRSRICGIIDRKATVAKWWLSGGISAANSLAAYDCLRTSLSECYINRNNPGTYDATAVNGGPNLVEGGGIFFYPNQALSTGYSGATKPVSVVANIRLMSMNGAYRSIYAADTAGGFGFQINNTDNKIAVTKINQVAMGISNSQVTIGVNTVIAGTYGSTGDLKIFINGVLDVSTNSNQTFVASTARVGLQLTNQQAGVFILYHLSTYNVEITEAQVKAVSNAMRNLSRRY